jgi:response regulator RpfG family c-di-GMP phosphodiesterase
LSQRWYRGCAVRRDRFEHKPRRCHLPRIEHFEDARIDHDALEAHVSKFTVLLVEDDILQRDMLAAALKDEGLEVIECGAAEAAELVVATSGTELRALVTDNYLDGAMTGVELAHFARRKLPLLVPVVN